MKTKPKRKTIRLRCCPFCGAKAELGWCFNYAYTVNTGRDRKYWCVACTDNACRIHDRIGQRTKAAAAKRWNRRA